MEQPPRKGDHPGQGANLAVLIVAIVIVVGGVWLMVEYKKSSDLLDCLAAGHKNCVPPIPVPSN